MFEFLLLGSKLLHRAAHVFVGTEITARPEIRNVIGFANVGTLHQHIQRGGESDKFCLVVVDVVRVVVITDAIMVVAAKAVQGCAVALHGRVGASVFSKQGNAVVAKPDHGRMCFVDEISVTINAQTEARLVAVKVAVGAATALPNVAAAG